MDRSSSGVTLARTRRATSPQNELDAAGLIRTCEEVLKSYDPVKSTLDSHAHDVLGGGNEESDSQEKTFIKQVLYGCVRYKNSLKAFLTSMYFNHGSTTSRADYTKYMILAYLAIFRLDEIGFTSFAKLVRSQPAEKMHVFLSYLFNKESLDRWVKEEWMKQYDLAFVESTMIGSLMKFSEQARDLCDALSSEAFGLAKKRELVTKRAVVEEALSKPPTVPKPFNITPVRPVRVPEPIKIKQDLIAKPAPKHLNDTNLSVIEEERKRSRRRVYEETLKKYDSSQHFKLHSHKDTVTKALEEKERQIEKILAKQFVANPVPDFDSIPAQVKMNTSTILREDALYKKKQAQEAKLLQSFESELRDSSEFYRWQNEMKTKDEEERIRTVERRRQESVAAQEEARLAMERQLDENRRTAKELRSNNKEMTEERRILDEFESEEKRRIVELIQSRKDAPQQEKERLVKKNRQITKQMRKEQSKLEEEKRIKDEEEQLRRSDLIRQIRALERVPTERTKQFDPTESGGHGLLEEMSLLELKERLAINQMKEKQSQREFRKQILQQKKEKEKAMQERIEGIRRARDAASIANQKARDRQRETDAEKQRLEQEVKDQAKLNLLDKLARIRQTREEEIQKLQEEEEKVHQKNLFLGGNKDMIEQKVHGEFLKGSERKAREAQKYSQQLATSLENIKSRERSIRTDNKRKQDVAQRASMEKAQATFLASQREQKEAIFNDFQKKRILVQDEQERFNVAKQQYESMFPYAAKMGRGTNNKL